MTELQSNQRVTCPICGFKSIKKVVSKHYHIWHIKRILGKLIFNNPCFGCLNLHKPMKNLSLSKYQKLCLTHREMYDGEFD